MNFNLTDYRNLLSTNRFIYPQNFKLDTILDRHKYNLLQQEHDKSNLNVSDTFIGLHNRVGDLYFRKVYQAQSAALNFSETSFPPYKFLMPEVLTDDWLAIVDVHKKHCRDHALHQPLTSYVVYKLLGGGNSANSFQIGSSYLLDLCVDSVFKILHDKTYDYFSEFVKNLKIDDDLFDAGNNISRAIWKAIFFETAMRSATFHDIGYPWQYLNRLNKGLDHSDFNPDVQPIYSKNIIDNFGSRLIMSPFNGYKTIKKDMPSNWNEKLFKLVSKSLNSTHGFPGALGYLYLNDVIREYPSKVDLPLHQLCIEWAALGIMMHDMGSIYWGKNGNVKPESEFLRLNFNVDPLSSIIALADVIEDFERPNIRLNKAFTGSFFEYDSDCYKTEIDFAGTNLNIRYTFIDPNIAAANRIYKLNDQKNYFDTRFGYLNLSCIGINSIQIICAP